MAIPLQKLEDQLNCSICLETYNNPKQLQCSHVYCQQCLVKLVTRDQQGWLSLICPNCRQVTPVPASGVAGLQAAFRVNQLLELVKEHKKTAPHFETVSIEAPPQKMPVVCTEHGGKEVALYCETCESTICWKCIKNGEKHHSHKYEELGEAFELYSKEIMCLLEPMVEQLSATKDAIVQLNVCCENISSRQSTVETDIHGTFARLHKMLDARKTELINQLHQLTQTKLKSLAAQKDQLETTQAQLSSTLLFIRKNLETGNQAEALQMKSTTVRQVKELTTTFQPDMLKPNTEADMIFIQQSDLSTECHNYGKVYAENLAEPSKCYVKGEIDKAKLRERYSITLHTTNFDDKGSPFPASVIPSEKKFGTPILSFGVRRPEGVTVNQRGEVVVTDCDEHTVSIFSSRGMRLRSFGKHGSAPGQFNYPVDVAVDAENNILVADYYNHRIQKFTSEGEFLQAVDTQNNGGKHPCGIAFNPRNGRVYVGNQNGRIHILNSDLSHHATVGKKGHKAKGQLYSIQHLACDSTGNVYVVDRFNFCIQVFTAEGKFLRVFGGRGEEAGKLNNPDGIAIDSRDRVYVSELGCHRVSVFTSEGAFVTSFGSKGKEPGQFDYPHGLAVDGSGVVYVCDCGNRRVQLF